MLIRIESLVGFLLSLAAYRIHTLKNPEPMILLFLDWVE